MALTPERIAELERLKAMMQPAATEAKRKAQAILNAEKGAGQPVKLPIDYKSKGGLEKFLKPSKIKQRLYHGTKKDIKQFDSKNIGANDFGWYGRGHYLTADPGTASAYTSYDDILATGKLQSGAGHGANVMPLHVQAHNPYYWPEGRKAATNKEESEALTKELLNLGYDSVIVGNKYQDPQYAKHHEVVLFDPRKIKSAIGNRGTYDINNPDITKAKGGSILKDIHAHILKTKGEHGARRVQRAADEIPGLEGMFTPEALRFTLGRSDAGLMSMDPAEFERFALRLNPSQEDLELSKIPVEYAEGMPPMSQEQYIKYLAKLKKGFNEVPFLELGQRGSEYLPSIEGHEGRHRSRAMAGKGVKKSLVQLMPSDRLRGVMPKNSSERFVEKMQQVLGDKRLVTPEGRSLLPADLSAQEHRNLENRNLLAANRPQLPEVYSDGGSTTKDMDVMRLALMKRGGKPPEVTKVTKKADDRIPELEEAARALLAGEINRTAYDKILKQFKPVRPYTSVPAPATDEEALNALYENKRDKWKANQFQAGDPVGMRLDIPSYQQHGVWVNSLHDEGGRGLPTSYAPVSSVRNAVFDAKPSQAQRVATGETKKSPFAKIKGEWHPIDEQEALAQMQEYLNHPEWHQVGMDPRRRDYFYSRKDSRKPVTHAEHVLQIGPLVLAKNPVYGKRKDFGLADGGSVTHAHQLDIEERPL